MMAAIPHEPSLDDAMQALVVLEDLLFEFPSLTSTPQSVASAP